MTLKQYTHTLATLLVVLALVGTMFAAPVAAITDDDTQYQDRILVDVKDNGDVEITYYSTYELDDDVEASAFSQLGADDTSEQEIIDRYEDRMKQIAENTDGHDADSITDASILIASTDLEDEDHEIGLVETSVTWTGLAEEDGESYVLTEPFASGFENDRQLILDAPSDHHIESAEPFPTDASHPQASWEAGTDMTGYELVFTPPEHIDDDTEIPVEQIEAEEEADDEDADEDGVEETGDDGTSPALIAVGVVIVAGAAALVYVARTRDNE